MPLPYTEPLFYHFCYIFLLKIVYIVRDKIPGGDSIDRTKNLLNLINYNITEEKMKIKQIISLFLSLCLIFSSTVVYASESVDINKELNNEKDEYIVKDLGTGAYKIVDTSLETIFFNSEENLLSIVKVNDDIYKVKDKDSSLVGKNEMFLKVKNNIFQKVEKVELGKINKSNVEDKIVKHNIKDEIAEDLRRLASLSESENSEIDATLYTPTAATYYVGYMDYNYCDEVLYYYNRTPFEEVKSDGDLADVANITIRTIAEYILEDLELEALGSIFILSDMFSSVFVTFPVNTGDWWQVQLYETKYIKYTGIDNMWDGTYSTKAISERGSGYFNHIVYDYSDDLQSPIKKSPTLTYVLDNYYNLDYYAYLHQYPSDIPYIEEMSRWRVNNFYSFTSI